MILIFFVRLSNISATCLCLIELSSRVFVESHWRMVIYVNSQSLSLSAFYPVREMKKDERLAGRLDELKFIGDGPRRRPNDHDEEIRNRLCRAWFSPLLCCTQRHICLAWLNETATLFPFSKPLLCVLKSQGYLRVLAFLTSLEDSNHVESQTELIEISKLSNYSFCFLWNWCGPKK